MQKNLNIKLILDTHIFIWLINNSDELSQQTKRKIVKIVEDEGDIGISTISLWEISMLHSRNRILLNQPCLSWIKHSLQAPGIQVVDLSPEIVVDGYSLPNQFHGDPWDRIIVASARILDVPLMSRDERILDYSKEGFVKSIKA
jgi:PIN domain nuclease of toxin-antitoxin system